MDVNIFAPGKKEESYDFIVDKGTRCQFCNSNLLLAVMPCQKRPLTYSDRQASGST